MTSRTLVSLKVLGAVAVGVLVTAVALCSRADSQQRGIADSSALLQQRPRSWYEMTTRLGARSAKRYDPQQRPRSWYEMTTDNDPRSPVIHKLDYFRKQLRAGKSAEQKDQFKASIRDALAEYFDDDMQQRRRVLEGLTKRSDDMAATLVRRAATKDQIIDLQLRAFKYEAEGLGLFSERRTGPRPQASAAGAEVHGATEGAYGSRMADGTSGMMAGEVDPITAALSRVKWQVRLRLQGAGSQEDESEVMTELREALGEYFDRDMESRQKELGEIKKGLADMSDCLKRRDRAKNEIVDLQLQMIVNEAEGLGFFNGSDAPSQEPHRVGWPWDGTATSGAAEKPPTPARPFAPGTAEPTIP